MTAVLAIILANLDTAKLSYDGSNNPSKLEGTISGKPFSVAPAYSNDEPRLTPEIRLKGQRIQIKGGLISGSGTVNSLDVSRWVFPNTPKKYDNGLTLQSKGGIVLGETALWLFGWDALETMGEPSADTFAVEIGLDKTGRLNALRASKVTGVGRHCNQPLCLKNGNQLALSGSGLSIFDLKAWKETESFPEESSTLISKRAFRNSNGMLFEYDFSTSTFKLKSSHTLGYLTSGFNVGVDEPVLLFTGGFLTPDTRSSYHFPGPDNNGPPDTFFIIDKKAIGFLSYGFPRSTPGILLSPKNLTPITMIKK